MTTIKHSVDIIESYEDYDPPINATSVTHKLIGSIPQKYLRGLAQIVITNRSSIPRRILRKKVKSRNRKIGRDEALGLYHHQTRNSQAWIEIYIDQISDLNYGLFQRIPIFREKALSEVLYHEIGHHIHRVIRPEHREPEDVAEEWETKLWGLYCLKRYWYLKPLFLAGAKLTRSKMYKRFYQKTLDDVIERREKQSRSARQ